MLKQRFSQGLIIGCMMSSMTLVQAESLLKKEQDYSLVPQVRFNIDLDKTRKDKYQLLDDDSLSSFQTSIHKPLLNETRLDQYDATLFYPLGSQGASFDLGLNMKYIHGQTSFLQDGQRQLRNFSAAIPMVYATALFDLPFEGFSAGFEGKHHLGLDSGDHLSGFDYKAKFKYEWNEGFGLQGGWQHQQYSLDNEEQTTNFENKGPFLDFYLRF